MLVSDAVLKLEIQAKPRLGRVVRERVTEFARAHGVDDVDLDQFLTALGEALANAIEHARCDGTIHVECRAPGDRIVATVQDDGVGFQSAAAAPQLPSVFSERGRGLPIMRRCSDIFSVTSEPGRGTEVIIGRYLHGHAAA
ncbi:MAG: ATP-binding protein [Candidatus Eremiobacteraeota bacterium]|nr:ATP-binding protein [Candidatus Eremiobacteraeota bacterium]